MDEGIDNERLDEEMTESVFGRTSLKIRDGIGMVMTDVERWWKVHILHFTLVFNSIMYYRRGISSDLSRTGSYLLLLLPRSQR